VETPRELARLEEVVLLREGNAVLRDVRWVSRAGERWVVLGPNGSGKTSLLSVAGAQTFPSRGRAWVLGEELGRTDMRALRERVGWVSGALLRTLRPRFTALEVVKMGRHGALEPWWHSYDAEDEARARTLLGEAGHAHVADRPLSVLSEGERQQVLLSRALMQRPSLLLLDEPFAGLDLGARERLLARLDALVDDASAPPWMLVTHHVEEIPCTATHALVLADGGVVAQGPLDEVLTGDALSRAFRMDLRIRRDDGRWRARASGINRT
jgi:iron complex transport system ATP-binding protein